MHRDTIALGVGDEIHVLDPRHTDDDGGTTVTCLAVKETLKVSYSFCMCHTIHAAIGSPGCSEVS
jgi:hypothetical protein